MVRFSRRRFLKLAGITGSLGLVASYPVFIERSIIQTNHYRIAVPHLPQAFSGLRIVHLTDLHHGLFVSLNAIEKIVKRANNIKPDLIVCTGDYVHERHATGQIDRIWPVLGQLTAPLGVFSVLGNHDHCEA